MTPVPTDPGDHQRHGLDRRRFLQAGGVALGAATLAAAIPTRAQASESPADHGLAALLAHVGGRLPFSFTYAGTPSAQLLAHWPRRATTAHTSGGQRTTVTWTDPDSGLRVNWLVDNFTGPATMRWSLSFDHGGARRSATIADVLALDLSIAGGDGDWSVHTNNGSNAISTDFAPLDFALDPGSFRLFSTNGGRPTNGNASPSSAWISVVNGTATGYVNNTQHTSTTVGSTASLTFTGTAITWIGAKNIDVGIADVYLDGTLNQTVDCYASSWQRQQPLFSATGLSNGQHTIRIVVTGHQNPAAVGHLLNVDAFQLTTVEGTTTLDDTDPAVVYAQSQPGDETTTSVVNGWPYLNVDWGHGGLIAALGWPGQWAMQVDRDGDRTLRIRGGMSHRPIGYGDQIGDTGLTSLWLDPGESISTPTIVVQPWHGGDWIDAQNQWRRWFVQHHMPRRDGAPVAPLLPTQSNDYFPDQYDTAADQIEWLNAYADHNATAGTGGTADHWWIDAGWSALPAGTADWNHPGSWDPDPTRYPDGLTPINDLAHRLGMRTIVWFEPERVRPDTWLYDNHPEWLLKSSTGQTDNFLLDFTNPDVQDWATQHIGDLINTSHIDIYREDFNIDPLPFWTFNDPPDRRGITQIRYVTGHLDYWRGLQARRPGLVIDTCASGGRRMDLETLSLAVNFLRSDDVLDALSNQVHQYGVARWVALSGAVVRITGAPEDGYNARSGMAPSYHCAVDVRDPAAPWAAYKDYGSEWAAIAPDMYGDYHPLLPFTDSQGGWTAWSFSRPSYGTGYLQAFRRPASTQDSQRLVLRGLAPDAHYQLTDEATGAVSAASGQTLMSSGLLVTLPTAPSATTIRWRRL